MLLPLVPDSMKQKTVILLLPPCIGTCTCTPTTVVPIAISFGTLMVLLGIATFTAGIVMLVKVKRVLDHSHKPPPLEVDHYEIVDEGKKSASLSAVVYEEVDKQDTQTDRHPNHYQELELTKMAGNEYASINA